VNAGRDDPRRCARELISQGVVAGCWQIGEENSPAEVFGIQSLDQHLSEPDLVLESRSGE
jgi:hypothetical protein